MLSALNKPSFCPGLDADRDTNRARLTRLITPPAKALGTIYPALNAASVSDSGQVSKLLIEARTEAYQLSKDAWTVQFLTRWDVSWKNHSAAVNDIKEHVTAISRTLAHLDEARESALPCQARVIDWIKPVLKEIASNMETVLEDIDTDPKRVSMTEYKYHLEANSRKAVELEALIADFVDSCDARRRRLACTANSGAAKEFVEK